MGQQPLHQKGLIGGDIRHPDFQKVIARPGRGMAFHHFLRGEDEPLERGAVFLRVIMQRDIGKGTKTAPHFARIDQCNPRRDHPSILQRFHPPPG